MSNIISDEDMKRRAEMFSDKSAKVFERGVVAGLVHCDEFGIPFDENYSENKNIYLDKIDRGITIGAGHGVASFPKASCRAEHYSPADIGRGNIHPSFQNFGSIDEMTDYTYQDMMARKAVPFVPASYSLRKFSDDELRENIMTMNHAITKDAVIEEKAKLRDHSYSFMLAKDKNKIDFKIYINSIFKKDEKDIKNKFVKDLYSTKILYKEFKHLNFAAKRLVLNNRLRANIIDHCSNTESAANDILVLLENDSSNFDYLFKHLQPAIRKMIDRGIAL